jgi:hypothetical protein
MDASFGFFQIESMSLGSTDNSGQRNFLPISLPQMFFDIAVIIRPQGDFFIFNHLLFDRQFLEEILLNLGRDPGRSAPLIFHGEAFRVPLIMLKEHEEPSFSYSQDLFNVFSLYFLFYITIQQLFDLI